MYTRTYCLMHKHHLEYHVHQYRGARHENITIPLGYPIHVHPLTIFRFSYIIEMTSIGIPLHEYMCDIYHGDIHF